MKKKWLQFLSVLVLSIMCVFGAVGCKGDAPASKEDMVYHAICTVAADYDCEPSAITVLSGAISEDEEDGGYNIWVKLYIGYSTYYFTAHYDNDAVTEYDDTTAVVEAMISAFGSCGPNYLKTDSFDCQEVNARLLGNE